MLKFKHSILVLAVAIFAYACGGSSDGETKSGLKYEIVKKGDGAKFKDNEVIFMDMDILQKDSVFFSLSELQENPLILQFDTTWNSRGQFFELMPNLKVGDSVQTKLTANEFFTNGFRSMPPQGMEPDSEIEVRFIITKSMSEEAYEAMMQEMMQEAMAKQQQQAEMQIEIDAEILEQYFAENNIEAQSNEDGLRYVIHKQGKGKKPQEGQNIRVHYTGRLLNGKLFDTSVKETAQKEGKFNPQRNYEPFTFQVGTGRVIRGWDSAFMGFNEGTKATIYIPSYLGYGARGSGADIPPNSCLVFEVEFVGFAD